MNPDQFGPWVLLSAFLLFGLGLIFAKLDQRQVSILNKLDPWFGTRLYQFRAFRYGVAIGCFVMVAVIYVTFLSEHPQ